ncbi:MAG: DUF2784 domain-containing protein [Pirellulales bacterium]
MTVYAFLADLVLVLHLAYVAFVVLGQAAILAGLVARWRWARNFWFRSVHLAAITIVAAEAALGIVCPLTVWEDNLRVLAGQPGPEGSFIGHWLHRILFVELSEEALTAAYAAFAMAVLATFVLAPPARPFGGGRPR